MKRRWSLQCSAKPAALPPIIGRIVVIGAENATDQKIILGQRLWGFELQAKYMETLLSGDYLRYPSLSAGFFIFALFIFLIEPRAKPLATRYVLNRSEKACLTVA